MARPKSALRQKLEEIANAHAAAAAAAAAAATTTTPTVSSSSPSYTESVSEATPSSTATWAVPDEEERSRIAAELERLSVIGPEQVNLRNWNLESDEWREATESVSPHYAAYWDNYPRALTFAENVAGAREMAAQDPMYWLEVEHISTLVDEVRGVASVIMHMRVTTTNVTYQGMSTLEWERDEMGKWLCVKHMGYRALNAGFD